MSNVRVLVGTKKGAFILTSDGTRKRWKVAGPHFGGWEMYHLKGSPADPNRIYALVEARGDPFVPAGNEDEIGIDFERAARVNSFETLPHRIY